jgi:hypothetical protein|eukprot:COSAG01_NODE_1903_length_8958_cov_6.750536_6_plen_71_part_00
MLECRVQCRGSSRAMHTIAQLSSDEVLLTSVCQLSAIVAEIVVFTAMMLLCECFLLKVSMVLMLVPELFA